MGDGVVGGARLEQELHPDAGLSLQDDAPPQPVLLRGDGDVGGARPERELHPDVGLSLQDDKSAGRLDWQALRPLPFHQPPSPAIPRQVTCVDPRGAFSHSPTPFQGKTHNADDMKISIMRDCHDKNQQHTAKDGRKPSPN